MTSDRNPAFCLNRFDQREWSLKFRICFHVSQLWAWVRVGKQHLDSKLLSEFRSKYPIIMAMFISLHPWILWFIVRLRLNSHLLVFSIIIVSLVLILLRTYDENSGTYSYIWRKSTESLIRNVLVCLVFIKAKGLVVRRSLWRLVIEHWWDFSDT